MAEEVSVGSALAVGAWIFGGMLMVAGSAVSFNESEHSWLAMILLAWAIFVAALAGTLTIRECTRKNRKVLSAALRVLAREQRPEGGTIARFPSR